MKPDVFPPGMDPIGEGTFQFACHPGLDCFTMCCRDVDMYLYPYDVIRMKKRLGITSQEFLDRYTVTAIRDNPFFPRVMLRMADQPGKPCPFLEPDGCGIYSDRPSSCREYPLERAVARTAHAGHREIHYFVKKAAHCLGHQEKRAWTVDAWVTDQAAGPYLEMNDLWVDIDTLFRSNPWGKGQGARKKLRMAFMACFNLDPFRRFVLESSFRSRFDVSEERIQRIRSDEVALLEFAFDWVQFFLSGTGRLASTRRDTAPASCSDSRKNISA